MEPLGFHISYELEDGGICTIGRAGFGSFACSDFELTFLHSDDVVSVQLMAAAALRVDDFTLRFAHDATGERILMNGYQSWTDTGELSIASRMTGLDNVPNIIVDRFVLDGGGDYRFTEYDGRPGYLHGWTYAVFRNDARCTLLASLDESNGFALIRTHGEENVVSVHPEPPQRMLLPGETVELCALIVASGPCDDVYDRWFAAAGIVPRTQKLLAGYSSWYRHYDDIDQAKLLDDLSGALKTFCSQEVSAAVDELEAAGKPLVRLFQIDDGWCTVGDWLHPHLDRFPYGMADVATDIRAAGFLPGLWMAPFVCSQSSGLMRYRPDWLLRDSDGRPVATGSHWGGAFALDTRNSEVRDYVREAIGHAVKEWGFGLLKLDFLYAACLEIRDGMNRGQLMADAMDLLRESAGDALILACGVPLGSAFGKADYCRVGCDVGLNWDDAPHMRLLHRERVSTRLSLHDAVARAPLNGRAFGSDPDVVFLRSDVKLSDSQRAFMYDVAATCGNVVLTSDDMGAWTPRQRKRFAEILRSR